MNNQTAEEFVQGLSEVDLVALQEAIQRRLDAVHDIFYWSADDRSYSFVALQSDKASKKWQDDIGRFLAAAAGDMYGWSTSSMEDEQPIDLLNSFGAESWSGFVVKTASLPKRSRLTKIERANVVGSLTWHRVLTPFQVEKGLDALCK